MRAKSRTVQTTISAEALVALKKLLETNEHQETALSSIQIQLECIAVMVSTLRVINDGLRANLRSTIESAGKVGKYEQ